MEPVVITPSETQTSCRVTLGMVQPIQVVELILNTTTAAGCDSIASLALTITSNPTISAELIKQFALVVA